MCKNFAFFQAEVASELRRPRSVSIVDNRNNSTLETTSRDFVEITSIPPLPLYALLAADSQTSNNPLSNLGYHYTLPSDVELYC